MVEVREDRLERCSLLLNLILSVDAAMCVTYCVQEEYGKFGVCCCDRRDDRAKADLKI